MELLILVLLIISVLIIWFKPQYEKTAFFLFWLALGIDLLLVFLIVAVQGIVPWGTV